MKDENPKEVIFENGNNNGITISLLCLEQPFPIYFGFLNQIRNSNIINSYIKFF